MMFFMGECLAAIYAMNLSSKARKNFLGFADFRDGEGYGKDMRDVQDMRDVHK
jgi:hypothetical protein